jgi:carbamoyltransferase
MARYFLGIHRGGSDPAVALVTDGKLIAFSEEERHIRFKHADGMYPIRALQYCLSQAGIGIESIETVAVNWNLEAYTNGEMFGFIAEWNSVYETDSATQAWQHMTLNRYNISAHQAHHVFQWRRHFGSRNFPSIIGFPHHFTHAFHAALQSGHSESIVITMDGSGDQHCTVVWHQSGRELKPLYEVRIPHSLGWFYAAFTEYLGFEAYDGEYKVMGLAAYGSPNLQLRALIAKILFPSVDGIGYCLDPQYIHYGEHSYSERFTDGLADLLKAPPRVPTGELTDWHSDLAYEVQFALEACVLRLATWAVKKTGSTIVCTSGGVAHNVKMNSSLLTIGGVDSVFPHPLCSDPGGAAGAALLACFAATGAVPEVLTTVAVGPEVRDAEIGQALVNAKCVFTRPRDICKAVAQELACGRIVAWCQGRMEAGPRALGQRSILADPRHVKIRDRVNAAIKYREPWRPFCPSMKADAASRYFIRYCKAPFMTLAFPVTDCARIEIPGVVHVDGTARVQFVERDIQPLFYQLLDEFEKLTGIPVLLNTSFNVKGEPIVCTANDALRTFWSTGLDSMALGGFLLQKERNS